MFISRIRIGREGLLDAGDLPLGSAYAMHRWIWELFSDGPGRRRDFIYRLDQTQDGPAVYTVSERRPESPGAPWRMETKPYEPRVETGEELAFTLRANPVVTRSVGNGGRSKRHDVVMDAKHQHRRETGAAPSGVELQEIAHQAGVAWLARKGQQGGFRVTPEGVRVDSYRVVEFPKESQGPLVRLGALDVSGLLTVTEPSAFIQSLRAGIGPAKGFGFGLLLVRRT